MSLLSSKVAGKSYAYSKVLVRLSWWQDRERLTLESNAVCRQSLA